MNTLFDMNDIPPKQPDSQPKPEYVITFTNIDGIQYLYTGSHSNRDEQVSQFTVRGKRQPKRFKTLVGARARCKAVNNTRLQWAVDANIVAQVIVWSKP